MARRKRKPSKTHRDMAKYVAMVIRNAMEEFHCKYLSDEQMKELNPIIRNAVCTCYMRQAKWVSQMPQGNSSSSKRC